MTPREYYQARLDHWQRSLSEQSRRAAALSRMRLVTFLAGAALLWWGLDRGSIAAATTGSLAIVAFGVLVRRHARVLDLIACGEAAAHINTQALARLDRNWSVLSPTPAPPPERIEHHPYARDLDVFGHASLTHWLGPCATPHGTQRLWESLLSPGPGSDVAARQRAIDELARDPDWRESLSVQGRLLPDDAGGLDRFLSWAEARDAAVPPVVRRVAWPLAASIWILLGLQLAGAVDAPWWLVPLTLGIVLSFAYAQRIYAAFDRASAGDRVLERYGVMLALIGRSAWRAEQLAGIRGQAADGGGAAGAVRALATIIQWSDLRRSAALLHFPIQALTLWDFHVLAAAERWRARSGASVRRWLEALGDADALSVIAAIRHDNPAWAFAEVNPAATSYVASGLAHPLISDERRVGNDVDVGPPGTLLLVTGSNMSGKSTLLRAIGLNAVLAQAGAPVCAASLRLPPVALQTSIRVQDSLELGLSYFMAALAALKRIIDAAEKRDPGSPVMLYLLDEILQGTNSGERAIAVRGVARHLLRSGAIGAMTTHDLTIAEAEPLASSARLVHFTEQVRADGTMSFDYRLRPGLAVSRNAIRLMQLIGIQP
jgi:hypothetical protein